MLYEHKELFFILLAVALAFGWLTFSLTMFLLTLAVVLISAIVVISRWNAYDRAKVRYYDFPGPLSNFCVGAVVAALIINMVFVATVTLN